MRAIGNHLQTVILRAVAAEAGLDENDREKPVMVVEAIRSTDWASATFVGALHEIELRIEGDAAAVDAAVAHLVEGLPERDIPISGNIVAEIGVTPGKQYKRNLNIECRSLMVNALTIID